MFSLFFWITKEVETVICCHRCPPVTGQWEKGCYFWHDGLEGKETGKAGPYGEGWGGGHQGSISHRGTRDDSGDAAARSPCAVWGVLRPTLGPFSLLSAGHHPVLGQQKSFISWSTNSTFTLKGDTSLSGCPTALGLGGALGCVLQGCGGRGGAGLHVASSISSEGAWETPMNKSTSSGALASAPGNHMMWTSQGEFFSPCSSELLS